MQIYEFSCFSTRCVLKIAGANASALANECFEICKNLHFKYNFFDPNSFISKINNRDKNSIKIDSQSASVLSEVLRLSKLTNYAFDISKISLKKHANLSEIEASERNIIGENALQIDGRKLIFSSEFTQIDLGGVIKEFAVDECAKVLKNTDFVINFGGDIRTNKSINIKLKNPQNPSTAITEISLTNGSLTSSANYERAGHIIGANRLAQASVFSTKNDDFSTLACGIFSTALNIADFALPSEFHAILIDKNNQIINL